MGGTEEWYTKSAGNTKVAFFNLMAHEKMYGLGLTVLGALLAVSRRCLHWWQCVASDGVHGRRFEPDISPISPFNFVCRTSISYELRVKFWQGSISCTISRIYWGFIPCCLCIACWAPLQRASTKEMTYTPIVVTHKKVRFKISLTVDLVTMQIHKHAFLCSFVHGRYTFAGDLGHALRSGSAFRWHNR